MILSNKESGANPSVLISDVGPRLPEKTDKDFKIDPLFACWRKNTPQAGSSSPYSGYFFSVNCLGSRLRNRETRFLGIPLSCGMRLQIYKLLTNLAK